MAESFNPPKYGCLARELSRFAPGQTTYSISVGILTFDWYEGSGGVAASVWNTSGSEIFCPVQRQKRLECSYA